MYGLSANSQNMQGEEIDLLCLEEPFRNALSLRSVVWRPPVYLRKVRANCPRVWAENPQDSWDVSHGILSGNRDAPISKSQVRIFCSLGHKRRDSY